MSSLLKYWPLHISISLFFTQTLFCLDKCTKVLIVMPLVALMQQQREKLLAAGYEAVIIHSYSDAETSLYDATTHIFVTPETLCDVYMKAVRNNAKQTSEISHLIVDESHCVTKW